MTRPTDHMHAVTASVNNSITGRTKTHNEIRHGYLRYSNGRERSLFRVAIELFLETPWHQLAPGGSISTQIFSPGRWSLTFDSTLMITVDGSGYQ